MTPTTPREALTGAITNYCTHTGKPTECDVGCGDCAEIVDDCRTALAPFMQEWRPISEAPKGKIILTFGIVDAETGNWHVKTSCWREKRDDRDLESNWEGWPIYQMPSHFMPLPKPPQVTNDSSISEVK
jgi:hypothetical protein